jgi:hypothetical protein
MDEQLFISRLLETENLTDNLEDSDANVLLDWAVGQVKTLIADPLMAGEKVNGLMAVLRKINHLVPDISMKSPQELAVTLADLAKTVEGVFGRQPPENAADLQYLAETLHMASTSDAIKALLEWISKE